ncbi:MAG: PTS sugar transporter subunit IIA [Chloroflexi bacterium]|nr:PTS sugar transporter subunit IIA [Chloroflexota bacterium]
MATPTQVLQIAEVITPGTIDLSLEGITDKESLIRHLISLLRNAGKILSADDFREAVYYRESLGPTYMGNHIAIPHGKSKTVTSPAVAFGRSADGIQYDTELGGGPAKLIFLLAIPDRMAAEEYVRVLARLARLLVHQEFVNALYQARNHEDVVSAIRQNESLIDSD